MAANSLPPAAPRSWFPRVGGEGSDGCSYSLLSPDGLAEKAEVHGAATAPVLRTGEGPARSVAALGGPPLRG